MEKIAIFDFCGTIADFQTFDPFLEFIIQGEHLPFEKWLGNVWLKKLAFVLSRLKKGFYLYKRLLIRACKGVSQEKILMYAKHYYKERVKPHCIPEVAERMAELKSKNYRIIILSAGAGDYIREYAIDMGITDIIANEFLFRDGICSGKLREKDCMRREKVCRLKKYLADRNIYGEICYGFSDSFSDMPFLDLCKNKVIISHKYHQKWVTDEMEEIVWE